VKRYAITIGMKEGPNRVFYVYAPDEEAAVQKVVDEMHVVEEPLAEMKSETFEGRIAPGA